MQIMLKMLEGIHKQRFFNIGSRVDCTHRAHLCCIHSNDRSDRIESVTALWKNVTLLVLCSTRGTSSPSCFFIILFYFIFFIQKH